MFDILDDFVFGPLNFIDRIIGAVNRSISPSKGGRFGKTYRITVPRIDKGGKRTGREVMAHLKRHGVPAFGYGYNSKSTWFYVRETQRAWATWLYNEKTQAMRTPKSNWKDRQR